MKKFALVLVTLLTACSRNDLITEYNIYPDDIENRRVYNMTPTDTITLKNGDSIPPYSGYGFKSKYIPELIDTFKYPQYNYFYNDREWIVNGESLIIVLK